MKAFFSTLSMLTPEYRRKVWSVAIFLGLAGIFEVIGLASVGPLLQAISAGSLPTRIPLFKFQIAGTELDPIVTYGIFSLALVALSTLFSILSIVITYKLAFSIGRLLTHKIYMSVLSANPIKIRAHGSSTLIKLITQDANFRTVHSVLVSGLMVFAKSFLAMFVVISLLFIDVKITLSAFLLFGTTYSLIYLVIKKRLSILGKTISTTSSRLISNLSDCVGAIREIYVWGRARRVLKEFDEIVSKHNESQFSFNWIAQTPKYLVEGVTFSVLIIFCVATYFINGSSEWLVSKLTIFAIAGYRLLPAIQQVFLCFSSVTAHEDAVYSIQDFFKDFGTAQTLPPQIKGYVLEESIKLDNVTIVYGGNKALDSLSLEIRKGEKVAFIGPSGGGKTTCLNVLLGLQPPSSGEVLLDGKSIATVGHEKWAQSCSLVSQEIFVLDASINENVCFFSDTLDALKLQHALRDAEIDFLDSSTPIGVGGTSLSGGQRQRIGIARALYKECTLLALDEATSALDNLTEEKVLKALLSKPSDKAIVMTLHRLHNLPLFDKVFVFDAGRLEAVGTPAEISNISPVYRKLVGVTEH